MCATNLAGALLSRLSDEELKIQKYFNSGVLESGKS
jgi:hypothetical protein